MSASRERAPRKPNLRVIDGGLSKKPTLWVIEGAFVIEPYLGGMQLGELSTFDVAGYELVHYTQVEFDQMCEDFFAEHGHYPDQ
jgi:hypothetical protein